MTAIRFPDAQLAVRNLLRSLLASRTEPSVLGVTVSTKSPNFAVEKIPLPYVQVRTDSSLRDARLNGRSVVRVNVWHKDEGLGVDLSSLAEALLLAASSTDVRGIGSLTSPVPTSDPDTNGPLSTFSVTAYLRPIQL